MGLLSKKNLFTLGELTPTSPHLAVRCLGPGVLLCYTVNTVLSNQSLHLEAPFAPPTVNLILNSSLWKLLAGFPRWLFATVFVSNPVWTNCFSTPQAFIVPSAKEAGRSAKVGGRIPEQTRRPSWVRTGRLAGVVDLREEAACGRHSFSFELSSLFPSGISS